MASPGAEPYDTVKSILMLRFAKSEMENVNQRLYTPRLLLDEKPSFHLEKLRKLMCSCPCDQDNRLLRRIFLGYLLSDVHRILAIHADDFLDSLTQIARRLFDDDNFRSATTQLLLN